MNRRIGRGISCEVPVFPPAPTVTVVIDGRRLPQYARAFVAGGRVYAAASPLLRRVADRMWVDGGSFVVECNGRRVRVPIAAGRGDQPSTAYVAVGPLLRGLGDGVHYRAGARALDVRTRPAGAIATPTPFRGASQAVAPRAIFTPEPVPTTRPVWKGPPLPRRTPLPFPPQRRPRGR